MKASQALIGVALVILTSCKPQEPDTPQASSPQVAAASEEAALTEAFISAVNTDDKQKLQALLHSQCRAHITAENQGFFDVAFDRDLAERGLDLRFDLDRLDDPAFMEALRSVYPEPIPVAAGRSVFDVYR